MSSIKYNPNPARVWSRVQNRCSTDTADSTVDYARIDYDRQMLLKGNILQYKKNSSNLTKNQRYTQIAKGMWTNRTKTWATQSDTYTNPNNSSLLRVNYNILDPSNNTFSSRSNPFNCPTTEIQDGGNLVCSVVVNPCTQEVIKRSVSQQLCNPTSDSDVPGQIQQLCWNDGTQTWYPRQRYTMGNSGTSWPEGYKGFVSAFTLEAPVLTLDSSNNNSVTLSWTAVSNDCMPISSFNIYQNGILTANVLYPINTITITIDNICGSDSFYVTSLSNDIESEPSNIINVSKEYNYIVENAVITNNGKTITFLQNGSITFYCSTTIKYMLVGGGGSGGYDSSLDTGLAAGGGGHVLNSNFFTTSVGATLNITIGAGGLATTSTGAIGGDTSITGAISKSTANSTYGGGGGGGSTGLAFPGGGGSGNGTTSAVGGTYGDFSTGDFNNNGTGGAGGSLTTEIPTLTTLGNFGGSNSSSAAGNGGPGQLGIDGNYYGGGGGGGIRYVGETLVLCGGGAGGAGGGGGGATPSSSAIPGTPNTGGGGGGGYYLSGRPYPSANGGSGIAIIMIQ
jgi:hypothetical protein